MPLESLWWMPDMADFDPADKSKWSWTNMICLPDAVTDTMARDVTATTIKKKDLIAAPKVRFATFHEGPVAQILHIGPYAEEAANIESLHQFTDDNGHTLTGKHHEIYLSDARKTDPAKLRTIIRQPFAYA